MSALLRLIGTCQRKIVICDVETEAGQMTATNLRDLGWQPYSGPAQVDKRGFILEGTDPALKPAPLYGRRHP